MDLSYTLIFILDNSHYYQYSSTRHAPTKQSFLDAIASSSSYPCQWVISQWLVGDNFRFPIYSLLTLPTSLISFLPAYLYSCHSTYIPTILLAYFLTYLLTYLCTCSPCSPNNTIITITCQFYCLAIASTDLCELVQR